MSWAVQVHQLRKVFGDKVAVDSVDLAVPVGTFFGLLGPNGAGKSTTLAMITGLLRPDSGHVSVAGIDVWSDPVTMKAKVGVVPETLLLFEQLSGRELLDYVGRLRGLGPDAIESRSDGLLDVLGLSDDATKMVADYSQGMRKKISLAAALLHAPQVLFLDEPFESVDPISVRAIKSVLQSFVASGATIVFSSHVMATVESLCDHVAIMNQGRIVSAGSMDVVRGGASLEEAFASVVGAAELDHAALSWLRTSE